jgi:glycosyltransferase involved in cell wall biosynthesis
MRRSFQRFTGPSPLGENADVATIVHFSTVHPRDDSRIRSKMMSFLQARFPGQVALFVQDGLGNERDAQDGYEIIDTGPRLPRFKRMSIGGWRMFRAVVRAGPTIAHFHDPELIPWGAALRLFGIRVIYDVHEDYPEAVRGNLRLPPLARSLLPSVVRLVEWASVHFFSAIITVTPRINQRFPARKAVMVRNWPVMREFEASMSTPMRDRPNEFAYVGSISLHRNIIGMIDAAEMAQDKGAVLRLAGEFMIYTEEAAVRNHLGWENVRFDGWVTREEIAQILKSVRAGLVV